MRRIVLYISFVLMAIACTRPAATHVVRGDVSVAYLRSLADDRSQRIKSDLWIEGDVVLNDKIGESYKSLVLYDGTAGVELKVDIDKIDYVIPLFSHFRLRCEGLYIGREGNRVVLGAAPSTEYVVDRISESELDNRVEIIWGKDNTHAAKSIAIGDMEHTPLSSYVRIEHLTLVGEESGQMWCDGDAHARPYESSLHHFTDGADTLTVATLNKSYYATESLPDGLLALMGVVDSYDGQRVLRLSNRSIDNID